MRRTPMRGGALLAAAAMLFTAGGADAQFPLTFVAGPNFTTVSTDAFDTGNRTGFFAAVGTAFGLGEQFSFQPFVAYVQRGAEFEGTSSGTDTYTYIDLVGFFGTAFPVGESVDLTVSAGPRVSFNLSCTEDEPDDPDQDCKDFNDYTGGTDFGIVGGVGLQFPVGSNTFGVGAGYDLGLKDIFEDIPGGYKNRGFYLYGSYTVLVGGA